MPFFNIPARYYLFGPEEGWPATETTNFHGRACGAVRAAIGYVERKRALEMLLCETTFSNPFLMITVQDKSVLRFWQSEVPRASSNPFSALNDQNRLR
jgi:hypothetical protein